MRQLLPGGSIVYRYDLEDTTDRLRVSLRGVGGFSMAFSKDGETYIEDYVGVLNTPTAVKATNIYDVFADNPQKTLYIKITPTSQEGFKVRGIDVTATGVPAKPVKDAIDEDDGIDFDYGVDGEPDYIGKLPNAPTEPDAVPVPDPTAKGGCSSSDVMPFVAIIMCVAAQLRIKR